MGLAVCAALAVASCDASDPFGLQPEAAIEVVAPLELTGRVVDAAGILTADEQRKLDGKLADIEKRTLAQLVVVTTPSLEGKRIEDYSLALGRGWGIGDAERNDGLLMVVAPNERQVRIEVGYGLEETVDDVFAKEIIVKMTPHFSEGRFHEGIETGIDLLNAKLGETKMKEAA
ncbi:TPM domain-containing protein [Qipengyuania aquimaris]|uniref:TPM domain-containing protein n=1 Tax=Qipengyuania aquimaris TaxID=255984 RepID=UPI001FD11D53|nr:TPM domain-containing protein [Qipengyuania aquimaris]UOR14346.1 TPM domain-containing protein [Qipengyuania aquimaris]